MPTEPYLLGSHSGCCGIWVSGPDEPWVPESYKIKADNGKIYNRMLTKGTVTAVREETGGNLAIEAADTLLGPDIVLGAELVVLPTGIVPATALDPTINLIYRQGPAFPDLELFDGYADSNYVCFPYETRRTGVYAAGCVRQPMVLQIGPNPFKGY